MQVDFKNSFFFRPSFSFKLTVAAKTHANDATFETKMKLF
jgi:hypothetical protein